MKKTKHKILINRNILKLLLSAAFVMCCTFSALAQLGTPPNNEIWYTSNDKTKVVNGYIQTIQDATTLEDVTTAKYAALAVIDLRIAKVIDNARNTAVAVLNAAVGAYQAGKSEALGTMGTECTDCPAVKVTKGDKTVKLYNPEKVEFIKE